MDVGAAAVIAVIGRLLGAADTDQGGNSTVGAEARRGLKGWGGHERSVRVPAEKGNGIT